MVLRSRYEEQGRSRFLEIDVCNRGERFERDAAGFGDDQGLKRRSLLFQRESVDKCILESLERHQDRLAPLGKGLMCGQFDLRNGQLAMKTPCGGAESMATDAAARSRWRRSWTTNPPIEWPTRIGGSPSPRIMTSKCSRTDVKVRRPSCESGGSPASP